MTHICFIPEKIHKECHFYFFGVELSRLQNLFSKMVPSFQVKKMVNHPIHLQLTIKKNSMQCLCFLSKKAVLPKESGGRSERERREQG